MQTFKINQYNFLIDDFINNEIVINPDTYYDINYTLKTNYFFIDGMNDMLFVDEDIEESNLSSEIYTNYSKVVNYLKTVNEQIDYLLDEKVKEKLETNDYSRYKLYNKFNINDLIVILNENQSIYRLYGPNKIFKLNLNENMLISGNGIKYNPYANRVENFEELYNKGVFEYIMEDKLRKEEYSRGIAPKFIYEMEKIHIFLNDKRNVYVKLKDCEKYKVTALFNQIIKKDESGNNYELVNDYSFEEYNQGKNLENMKVDDLEEITFGKNQILKINPENLKNLYAQIVVNSKDKLDFILDVLQTKLKNEFYDYTKKIENVTNISRIDDLNKMFRYKDSYKDEWNKLSKEEINTLIDFHRKSILIELLKQELNFKDLKELIDLTKDAMLSDVEKELRIELKEIQQKYDSKLNDDEKEIYDCELIV